MITMPKVKVSTRTKKIPTPFKKKETCDGAVQELITDLEKSYKENENPRDAAWMKKYMRGQFEYFGLKSPLRKSLDKEVCTQHNIRFSQDQILQLLTQLWLKPEREFQGFGIEYASKNLKILLGEDSKSCMKSLIVVKQLLLTKSWWDTVDMLASKIVGGMVLQYPSDLRPVMDEWIDDDNMWIRRTAILHQLSFKSKTDSERLFSYCIKRCHEKEFFIQKSIGWALREYAKTDREGVKTFINKHRDKMANLSVREGLKHIS